ncbi:MAG TPA: FdtA/QdtA family cupin domain-containing protein [Rhodanobacteraceae bacterium]|nr:FdtA/QdtA family cupin domain-containing protein [Rhodanobacteraceae bacterium]
MTFRLIELKNVIDPRGNLCVAEHGVDLPFQVVRMFVVYQVPLVEIRGQHAHKQCHQLLMCVRGRIKVSGDDGRRRETYMLDRPNLGFYMPPMTWGAQFEYSPDAVLIVLASHRYDNDDYIRDYDTFLKMVGK